MTKAFSPLVSTLWLSQQLSASRVRIIDASYFLPSMKRDGFAEFQTRRIPSASYLNVDEVCDTASPFPHTLPQRDMFQDAVGKLGIDNDCHVVVYDCSPFGFFSSPRLWWMFRMFGHENVSVLNGGFVRWQYDQLPIDYVTPPPTKHKPAIFKASNPRMDLIRTHEQMIDIVRNRTAQVVDARSAGRFFGKEPEPRAGLRGGHMPHAHNIPFSDVIDNLTKLMLSPEEVLAVFSKAGVDLRNPSVTSCGSGITACILSLAAAHANFPMVPVYDGSWSQWGSSGAEECPVESGSS